jgi:hypothetical protein
MQPCRAVSRRRFVAAAVAVGATATAARPARARRFGGETIVGEGPHTFRVRHHFPQLPDRFTWQTTHGVALDAAGNLYVIHEGRKEQKDHPAIFVFDPAGKFVRAFGSQFQGGGHGIEVRQEPDGEFLYVCGYQQVKSFAKLTLDGEIVWFRKAPMESAVYDAGEDTSTERNWSRRGFLPTNFAFLDDGGFLLADGYGSYKIHRYDKDANWRSCCGGPGDGQGTFHTPHGLWVDRRPGRQPAIVVCDRAHDALQILGLDGTWRETIPGFGLPANLDTWRNLLLVPELKACVTLLDEKNEVVARLGQATERLAATKDLRMHPEEWLDGQFVHPHDACFTLAGDIIVAEWVATGRVTKLETIA